MNLSTLLWSILLILEEVGRCTTFRIIILESPVPLVPTIERSLNIYSGKSERSAIRYGIRVIYLNAPNSYVTTAPNCGWILDFIAAIWVKSSFVNEDETFLICDRDPDLIVISIDNNEGAAGIDSPHLLRVGDRNVAIIQCTRYDGTNEDETIRLKKQNWRTDIVVGLGCYLEGIDIALDLMGNFRVAAGWKARTLTSHADLIILLADDSQIENLARIEIKDVESAGEPVIDGDETDNTTESLTDNKKVSGLPQPSPSHCTISECNIGNMIADAMVFYARWYKWWDEAPIGLFHYDSPIKEDNLTNRLSDIETLVAPFGNLQQKMWNCELTGAHLDDLLMKFVGKENGMKMIHVSGIHVTMTPDKKMKFISVRSQNSAVIKYEILAMTRNYSAIVSGELGERLNCGSEIGAEPILG